MPRLFVAIPLPPDTSERLAVVRSDLLGARWIPPERMHLTVRFFGEVPREAVNEIAEALSSRSFPADDLRFTGVTTFGPRRDPRVLVARVRDSRVLTQMHEHADEVARRFDSASDDRPFRPHVTLARLKRADPAEVAGLCRRSALELAFRAESLNLYESRLSLDGPSYTVVAAEPLMT